MYGIPGDSLNGLTDAPRRDGELTWEHVRHEEAAALAAAGDAAVTGRLAVCSVSSFALVTGAMQIVFALDRRRVVAELEHRFPQRVTAKPVTHG